MKATLLIEKWPEPFTFSLEIKPKNAKAAVISGIIEQGGDVDLTIDLVTTTLESNREYDSPEQLERIREICEAVMVHPRCLISARHLRKLRTCRALGEDDSVAVGGDEISGAA